MKAKHMSNPLTYLEVKKSKIKITRTINTVRESVSYLPNGKTYELQTWFTDGVRRPISLISTIDHKVKGQIAMSRGASDRWGDVGP